MTTTFRIGDALELIESIPLKSLDLLVTDPPYAFGGSGKEHELAATVACVLRESAKRIKVGGWAVVFAASSWRSQQYMVDATRGILTPVRMAHWLKPIVATKTRTPGWGWASVSLIAFRRGKSAKLPASESVDWIVEKPVRSGVRAQLPKSVADFAVEPFSVSGGTFVDPFCGSGALVFAADRAGMRATGFEIDRSRIQSEQDVFGPDPSDTK